MAEVGGSTPSTPSRDRPNCRAVVNRALIHSRCVLALPGLRRAVVARIVWDEISIVTAAALCVKPRGQMTERKLANVDVLKTASTDFCTMRHLAMRLRGLLRGGTVEALDTWLADARSPNIPGMRRFARRLRQDMDAVSNAVLEPWSNGQVEWQINRLKMLKRAMYGRAGVDLLRARMLPLEEAGLHRE